MASGKILELDESLHVYLILCLDEIPILNYNGCQMFPREAGTVQKCLFLFHFFGITVKEEA